MRHTRWPTSKVSDAGFGGLRRLTKMDVPLLVEPGPWCRNLIRQRNRRPAYCQQAQWTIALYLDNYNVWKIRCLTFPSSTTITIRGPARFCFAAETSRRRW